MTCKLSLFHRDFNGNLSCECVDSVEYQKEFFNSIILLQMTCEPLAVNRVR